MGGDNSTDQCRLCGNSGEESLNLYDKTISKINLVNVINDTLHLTVRETDSLPKKICVTCKKIIEEFERFRQSCILVEKNFKLLSEDNTGLLEPECSLKEEENSLLSKEDKHSTLKIDVEPDLNLGLENIKVEVVDEDQLPDCSDGTHFSSDDIDFDEAVIKEPHKDDYILVKQDRFTLDENARRLQNNYVEYCKPGIVPSDRLLVENVKKRQALPEMWDVYEMESQHNMTKVTMRRYIISKEAFPCSLCNKCISVKSDPQEEENWDSSIEYQGHTEGVIDDAFDKNLTDSQSHKAGKKCSISPSCEICKKSFNRAQSLKRHYRTHYGYERLPCEVCGKGFSRKEHLARHMILHTGGRPFECICCKKRFTRKEHLTRHIQLHEGRDCSERPIGHLEEYGVGYEKPLKKKRKSYECRPKPYSCDICCAGFGQKEHLMKHLRRMHNQDYDGCPEAMTPTVNQNEGKVNSSTSCEGKKKTDPEPVNVPAQSPPPTSPAPPSLPAALALTPVSAQPVQKPPPVSSPAPAPSPATTLPLDMPTRSEKNLFLCELCPRSFSRSEQLGRHLKIHRRDSMFVNESRVPGTDITFSFTNSND